MMKKLMRMLLTAAMVITCFVFDALLWGIKKVKGYVIFPGG